MFYFDFGLGAAKGLVSPAFAHPGELRVVGGSMIVREDPLWKASIGRSGEAALVGLGMLPVPGLSVVMCFWPHRVKPLTQKIGSRWLRIGISCAKVVRRSCALYGDHSMSALVTMALLCPVQVKTAEKATSVMAASSEGPMS